MKLAYESRVAGTPSFQIEIDDGNYSFSFDLGEWYREEEMTLAANMLIKTFELGVAGHVAGLCSLDEMAENLRMLLSVPIGYDLLCGDALGMWSYQGPVYDESGELVPAPETLS